MTSHTRTQNDSFSLLAESALSYIVWCKVTFNLTTKKNLIQLRLAADISLRFNFFGSLTPPYGSMSERFRKQAHIQDENFGSVSQALESFSKLCIFSEPIVLNQEHSERLNWVPATLRLSCHLGVKTPWLCVPCRYSTYILRVYKLVDELISSSFWKFYSVVIYVC